VEAREYYTDLTPDRSRMNCGQHALLPEGFAVA
jgi:hypothetical protein